MAQEICARRQRAIAGRGLFVALVAAGLGCLPSAILHAQSTTVHGYITAVHPPDGFDVNGEHVITTAETQFGPLGTKNPVSNGPMRESVQIGAWVEVFGDFGPDAKTVTARSVLLRDAAKQKLAGLGIIISVVATAPELVIAADGYRIRVTTATEINYPKDIKSAADVRAGMWVLYEGKLDQSGHLVAGKIRFLQQERAIEKQGQVATDPIHPLETPQMPANTVLTAKDDAPPPGNVFCQTGSQQIVGEEILFGNPTSRLYGYDVYKISKDRALQSRVRRIGMSMVPAYQKRLTTDDPSKIEFLFCAVDNPAREVITSLEVAEQGRILVSAQLASRFKNDDQLAAVLADGIAYALHQKPPFVIDVNQSTLAAGAGAASVVFVPITGGAASVVVGSIYRHEIEVAEREQRWRVALQLMADAGCDPWQAPEAWRLARPGKLPADTSTLKYPDQSDYQFGILNLMYKKPALTNATASDPTAEGSASGKP